MRCWHGYLSGGGADCLHMDGPADATAILKPHHLLPHFNPDWFYLCCYWLTQVVLKKRWLNGCSSVVVFALLHAVCSAHTDNLL